MMGETQEKKEEKREEIKETGTLDLNENPDRHRIQLMTIIGEIEGHEAVSGNTKATKYEHGRRSDPSEYAGRGCGGRPCHRGDDRVLE